MSSLATTEEDANDSTPVPTPNSFRNHSRRTMVNYPTPGIPRTTDGKVNLAASAPHTAEGKPDLTLCGYMRSQPP